MMRWTLWVAVLMQAAFTLTARADTIAMGRQMADAVLRGDLAIVWTASTPQMRAAFGSVGDMATFRGDMLSELGEEISVLSEGTESQAGYDVFIRVSRWTGSDVPIEMVIAFNDAEEIAGFFVRPQSVAAASTHLDYQTKARMRLPVDGEWYVFWGGRTIEDNYHAVDAGQRFALDLLVMRDGRSYEGYVGSLSSYHCWERPILAPADGVVVRAVAGLPDQAIGSTDANNPAGNHVVIDFGNSEYGFIAHLRQDSVRFAQGDRVTAGQEIGRCGNSGNTSEPHLHFHLQTSPILGQGEGLPAQFLNYWANGVAVDRGEPRKGQTVQAIE